MGASDLDSELQKYYAKEAAIYDARRFSTRRGQLHDHYETRFLAGLLEPLRGRRVLDAPAGTGRIAVELARRGARVFAVDLTAQMLAVARSRLDATHPGYVHCVQGNGRRLPFPDASFDSVLSVRFLHLIPPSAWPRFLEELRRVLVPDGTMLVHLFNPLYGGPYALMMEGIRRLLGQAGERFVWPHQLPSLFGNSGLRIVTTTGFWLPGMGFLRGPDSRYLDKLVQVCCRRPLSRIAAPLVVVAKRA